MIGYIFLGLVAAFLAVVWIRTLFFRPKKQAGVSAEAICFDREGAVNALAALVKCKTVSYNDPALENTAEFDKLISLLPVLYPNVCKTCTLDRLPDRALLFKWCGKRHDAPSVMMAHYDVVPANDAGWHKPPFDAVIAEGVMWGRGTLDTKATFNGILCAADHLIGAGFTPENDIYFAFSGNEEVCGKGAPNIVNWFVSHGIQPALVVDEGGAVVENVFPGVKQPCGLIGIAEKGMVSAQFYTASNGGHASAPKPHTPVGILSAVCKKIEDHPFKSHLDGPAAQMFDTLGRHSSFLYRMIFANMWCFGWVIDLLSKRSGGEMNALVRTTVAFTQMQGSSARNVIPTEAKMVANMRLNPSDSVASALAFLQKTAKDDRVEITALESQEPSPISELHCPAWDKVSAAVAESFPGCIVSPYLMIQCSDARHYRDLSKYVYRFSAMAMTAEERSTIHGNNERIRLESIEKAVEFYIRLMKKC